MKKKIWIILIIVISLYSKTINMILELNSVGSVLDTQTLLVYPKFDSTAKLLYKKEYDDTCHTPINECSYEWRSVLSKEDLSLIRIYYKGV
jgi:hypothetical protein